MTDTLRTRTDLIENIFKDGLAPGAIKAQQIRDLITSMRHKYDHGFFDYNDTATSVTPIPISAGIEAALTNDAAGQFTLKDFAPYGVTDVWDPVTNKFDFSELPLGSMIGIRITLDVTTVSNNTDVDFHLNMAIGSGAEYELRFDRNVFKNAGTYQISRTIDFYLGNAETRDFPAEVAVTMDGNGSVTVLGWYVNIVMR